MQWSIGHQQQPLDWGDSQNVQGIPDHLRGPQNVVSGPQNVWPAPSEPSAPTVVNVVDPPCMVKQSDCICWLLLSSASGRAWHAHARMRERTAPVLRARARPARPPTDTHTQKHVHAVSTGHQQPLRTAAVDNFPKRLRHSKMNPERSLCISPKRPAPKPPLRIARPPAVRLLPHVPAPRDPPPAMDPTAGARLAPPPRKIELAGGPAAQPAGRPAPPPAAPQGLPLNGKGSQGAELTRFSVRCGLCHCARRRRMTR